MELGPGIGLVLVLGLMFTGSLLAGAAPYVLTIPPTSLGPLSGLGGGLLLGAAMSIVIPEGFHAMMEAATPDPAGEESHGHGHGQAPAAGIILVLGFLGMLLLERAQSGHGCAGHSHGHVHNGAASDRVGRARGQSPATLPGAASHAGSVAGVHPAALGLLVHCAADGLALGATALSGNTALGWVVSVAMLAHKAPMAFGLSAVLLAKGVAWRDARRTLLLFAAAAPAAATATYAVLALVPFPAARSPMGVAACLLASGGTFLYAATMHILPELLLDRSSQTLAAVVIGALLPAGLAATGMGHGH